MCPNTSTRRRRDSAGGGVASGMLGGSNVGGSVVVGSNMLVHANFSCCFMDLLLETTTHGIMPKTLVEDATDVLCSSGGGCWSFVKQCFVALVEQSQQALWPLTGHGEGEFGNVTRVDCDCSVQ